jgi:hypothetical protein
MREGAKGLQGRIEIHRPAQPHDLESIEARGVVAGGPAASG